jgi:hypothetical protein
LETKEAAPRALLAIAKAGHLAGFLARFAGLRFGFSLRLPNSDSLRGRCGIANIRLATRSSRISSGSLIMADLFESPKSLLRRANHHIDDLERQVRAFGDDNEWTYVTEKDTDGVTNIHKLKFAKTLFEHMPNTVFDAANNGRSVLDQTAYIVAQQAGTENPKSAKFPFGPTEADMINNARGGCKDVPSEIVSLFISFKPYKGGNNAIWGLNELANTPKHKLLYPITMGSGLSVRNVVLQNVLNPMTLRPTWDREKYELILLRVPPGTQVQYNVDLKLAIALDDVDEVLRGQRPVGLLRTMTAEVERVLMATEAECRRIGLI